MSCRKRVGNCAAFVLHLYGVVWLGEQALERRAPSVATVVGDVRTRHRGVPRGTNEKQDQTLLHGDWRCLRIGNRRGGRNDGRWWRSRRGRLRAHHPIVADRYVAELECELR